MELSIDNVNCYAVVCVDVRYVNLVTYTIFELMLLVGMTLAIKHAWTRVATCGILHVNCLILPWKSRIYATTCNISMRRGFSMRRNMVFTHNIVMVTGETHKIS